MAPWAPDVLNESYLKSKGNCELVQLGRSYLSITELSV